MSASKDPEGFRADIEGIRGLAVITVVLFHAGLFGLVGGFVGVDVFFVISGFLITGLLLREQERSGTIGIIRFYARRGRRLLPAALIVLLVTFFLAMNLVAPLDRPEVGLDGAAAALSIGNIRFAAAAGDYFSSVNAPSPFLHYWSLAVEEQFYLVWPALILVLARGVNARRKVAIALVAVIVASFAANVFMTDAAATWAFYSLPTRAWQLGLGGLLAVGAVRLSKVAGPIVGIAGWIGLGVILASVVTFDSSVAYPGFAAVLPTLGAVALLAGGTRSFGPGRLVSIKPLRFLGKISYSLYLVHWPILVLAPFVLGGPTEDLTRVGLVALSIAVAFASWTVIETPFRTRLPRLNLTPTRTVSVGVAAMLVVMLIAAGPSLNVPPVDSAVATEVVSHVPDGPDESWVEATVKPAPASDPTPDSTRSATPTATPTTDPIGDIAEHGALPAGLKPALAKARGDVERLRGDGCLAAESVGEPPDCVYGKKDGKFVVALVGDSHASQWFPALERLAKHAGWKIVTFVKVSCPFVDMAVRNLALKREYRECADFNLDTLRRLKKLKPDLTLISMSRIALHPMDPADDTVVARAAAVSRMIKRLPGKVAIIVDTPSAKGDVPGCISAHRDDIDACAIPHDTAFSKGLGAVETAAAADSGAGLIDLTSKIALGDGPVSVVVNGMIIYRDESHMTATFSRSLAPALGAAITAFLAR